MFLVDCQACTFRHLRGVRSIEQLENTDEGIVVTVPCLRCGYGCRILTGARSSNRPAPTGQAAFKPVA